MAINDRPAWLDHEYLKQLRKKHGIPSPKGALPTIPSPPKLATIVDGIIEALLGKAAQLTSEQLIRIAELFMARAIEARDEEAKR